MRTFNLLPILAIGGLTLLVAGLAVTRSAGDRAATPDRIARVEAGYFTDFGDDRRLVGAVDNVFVGRVIAQSGAVSFDEVPETQFHVDVLESIKGSLSGRVVVNQEGGKDGDTLVLFDDDPLLKPGQTYLFVTRLYRERNWHTLVPRYGDLPIADAREQAALVARFKKAVQEQIPYMPN